MTTRVALVTGGARGIGRAIVMGLAESGVQLVINDLPDTGMSESSAANVLAQQICDQGGHAIAIAADVGVRDQVERLFAESFDHFGRLDFAVANAAFNVKRLLSETDWSDVQRIMDVTMYGTLHIAQFATRQIMKQPCEDGRSRGKLLFIGSIHAEMAVPYHGVYAMAKASVNQLCRSLASEMLPHRINVNAINPGWIDTPGERNFISESELLSAARELPWGRLGTPQEIAGLAAYLLGPLSDYLTGEVVSMDGGLRIDQSTLTHGLDG